MGKNIDALFEDCLRKNRIRKISDGIDTAADEHNLAMIFTSMRHFKH